jgi:hypothetical protein
MEPMTISSYSLYRRLGFAENACSFELFWAFLEGDRNLRIMGNFSGISLPKARFSATMERIGANTPRLHGFHRLLPRLWELFYWLLAEPLSLVSCDFVAARLSRFSGLVVCRPSEAAATGSKAPAF